MTISLSSDRDTVDEYFKLRQAFPLSDLCEPSSLDCSHRSFLPNDLSLGSVCCDEAETEAPPAAAPLESLCNASVRHDGSYDVSVCHEGLYDVLEGFFLAGLFDPRYITERGCREDDGTLDILANLVSLQASISKKDFPTDGANWRNLKCYD